jgi:hypothetical protein
MVGQPMPPSRSHLITVPSVVPRTALTSAPRWFHPEVVLHTPLYPRPASPLLVNPQQRRGRSWDGRSLHNNVSAMTAGRRLRCRPRRPLLHPPCGVTAFDRGGPHRQPSRRGGTNVDESASGRPLSQTTPPSQTVQPRADASRARCPPTRWPPPSPGSRRASPAHGVGGRTARGNRAGPGTSPLGRAGRRPRHRTAPRDHTDPPLASQQDSFRAEMASLRHDLVPADSQHERPGLSRPGLSPLTTRCHQDHRMPVPLPGA